MIDVSLIRATNSLVSGGIMMRNAWGSTIETIVAGRDMPSDRAASTWPRGTASMPARIVSAMYAGVHDAEAHRAGPVSAGYPDVEGDGHGVAHGEHRQQRRNAAEELDPRRREPPVRAQRRQPQQREQERQRQPMANERAV